MAAQARNPAGQPSGWSGTPPSTGVSIGAAAMAMTMVPRSPAASRGGRMSRTTAPATTASPITAPWSVRNTSSVPMAVASAQPTEAAAKTPRDARSTGRRPRRSDSGPITSCGGAATARQPPTDRAIAA